MSQRLEIHAKSLGRCEVTLLDAPTRDAPGTVVELTLLKDTFDELLPVR